MSHNLLFGGGGSASNYAILLSILGTLPLLLMVILCACWKRTRQKEELMGLPGVVTPTNPEEHIHDISVEQPILNGSITIDVVIDDTDSNKRPTSIIKHRRSLPDIPNIPDLTLHCDPNGDNSSDLYATVHPPDNTGGSAITDQQSSLSQPDDPYARVGNGSKKSENLYSVVNENSNKLLNELSNCDNGSKISSVAESLLLLPSTSSKPPPPPIQTSHAPSPTNSTGGVGCSTNTVDSGSINPVSEDISAAEAVRGDVAASQELPYMTPPNVNVNNGAGGGPQVNFSGDSQDSSRGYTSITVRAPIKDIKDAYSDDSDEMYQTIPDANNQSIYTSGSETYAQIQPQITVAVEINNMHLQEQANLDYSNEHNANNSESTKQPPLYSHSRQGSNSSSIQNLGSPKPEKRPANSPLPPPPPSNVATSSLDKPIQNLNDMYAKVNKKPKRKDFDEDESNNPPSKTLASSTAPLDHRTEKKYSRKVEHNYETIKTSPKKSQQQNSLDSDPGYERLQHRSSLATEPGYESVNSNDTVLELTDPNYEQLRPKSPSTSVVQPTNSTTSSVNLTVDGYSVIRQGRQSTQSSVSSDILTRNSLDEPNYESMPNSENSDSLCAEKEQNLLNIVEYKQLHNVTSEDSNYSAKRGHSKDNSSNSSQLEDLDPNYESVRYDDVTAAATATKQQELEGYDDGYEKISKSLGKTERKRQQRSKSDHPDYETIGKGSVNSGEDFFEV